MSGPVSAILEQQVTGELRRQGIVVWLDRENAYTPFVDALVARRGAGEFPFPVVGFRGSFLELLFELEPYASGLDKQPLLVHMPGFNEESIRKTPVLELYEPGLCFRPALAALIREAAAARVAPAVVAAFVAGQPSLAQADAWLSEAMAETQFGLAAKLAQFGPGLLAQAIAQPAALAAHVLTGEDVAVLRGYIHKLTGMDEAWETQFPGDRETMPRDRILHGLGAWALAVEYVHDLRRAAHREELRPLRALSAPLVKACTDLAQRLRRDNPDAYVRIADETEAALADEMAGMTPDDLGQIDTFREEENRVLGGAVAALRAGQWAKAQAWCEVRRGDRSFWLARDQRRRWAWDLVDEAATFGATLARHPTPFALAQSLDHATEIYATSAFAVDRAHRQFEQRRLALVDPELPHYVPLREVATTLRHAHRAWADQLTRAFAALCTEHGFLPSRELRQRTLFEQVVHPLTRTGTGEKVALFVIDALRYEMAAELRERIQGPGTVVDLKARLAELPTITSVGMNALAPVASGDRLTVAGTFEGFKTGEYTVRKPEDRARAMGARSSGQPALLLKLAQVCAESPEALARRVKPHALIVVHSQEIDDAGEANVGLATFESTLRQIQAAWHHLQLAGVKTCVFTADHGFLLQDESTHTHPLATKRDPQRRHVLEAEPRAETGLVSVSVAALGYDGISGYLSFRNDSAVFATASAGATFVHGGNSPQERVIPVLTVTRRHAEPGGYAAYEVVVEPLSDALRLHRLRLRLDFARNTTARLGFAVPATVDLALHVPERAWVQVILKDVTAPGALQAGRIRVPVGGDWSEVFFDLVGPADERVQVEVHHPDHIEHVRSARLDPWYDVNGSRAAAGAAPMPPPAAPPTWTDAIADEGIRKVFLHIEKHGVVTEPEVASLLGSARAFRRFSLAFDTHLPQLPFRVRIEAADGGKRYVREGDR